MFTHVGKWGEGDESQFHPIHGAFGSQVKVKREASKIKGTYSLQFWWSRKKTKLVWCHMRCIKTKHFCPGSHSKSFIYIPQRRQKSQKRMGNTSASTVNQPNMQVKQPNILQPPTRKKLGWPGYCIPYRVQVDAAHWSVKTDYKT